MPDYLHRIAEKEINETLLAMGAVLVQGARAVGKSTLAKKLAKSDISLDASASLIELAKISPDVVLAGQTPLFID